MNTELNRDALEQACRAMARQHSVGICRTMEAAQDHVNETWGRYKRELEPAIKTYLTALPTPDAGDVGEWEEPPLTCPHIDSVMAGSELSDAVKAELGAIRDINSQLRFGTWALKDRIKELEGDVTIWKSNCASILESRDGAEALLEQAKAALEQFADPSQWTVNGRFDPHSGNFDATSFARATLAAMKGDDNAE